VLTYLVSISGLYSDALATVSIHKAERQFHMPGSISNRTTATITGLVVQDPSTTTTNTVVPISVGGVLTANQTLCSGVVPSAITLTGNVQE
jgi:hypothetical protein